MIVEFSPEVCEKLDHYVYRLEDPRDGKTFYVGKGQNNRIHQHLRPVVDLNELKKGDDADKQLKNPIDFKINKIQHIRSSGNEVRAIIHRHGMDGPTAFHVESALIAVYLDADDNEEMANKQFGHGHADLGPQEAGQLALQYGAEFFAKEGVPLLHDLLLLNIRILYKPGCNVFDVARCCWIVNAEHARGRVVIAHTGGLVRGVFKPSEWIPVNADNFGTRYKLLDEDRHGFIDNECSKEIEALYLHKRVPERFLRGMNPVRYMNKDAMMNGDRASRFAWSEGDLTVIPPKTPSDPTGK